MFRVIVFSDPLCAFDSGHSRLISLLQLVFLGLCYPSSDLGISDQELPALAARHLPGGDVEDSAHGPE